MAHDAGDSYLTIASSSEAVYKEKSSKFLAYAYPVKSEDEIHGILDKLHKRYYDATHHCYAWRLGPHGESYRANDDGEPSGTAGRPMLTVLLHCGVGEIAAVVTRYFGGILLGTGGLVRAYQGSVKLGLETLPTTERVPCDRLQLTLEHPFVNIALREFETHQAQIIKKDFGLDATFTVSVPQTQTENLIESLTQKTSGALLIEKL